MAALFALARALFRYQSWCALGGALVGAISGLFFSLFQQQEPTLVLVASEILAIGSVLGLVGWLFVLLVVGVWLHYEVTSIAVPAFVTSLLTAILTVYFNNLIRMPAVAVIVGVIIGILIGYILGLLCRRFGHRSMRLNA